MKTLTECASGELMALQQEVSSLLVGGMLHGLSSLSSAIDEDTMVGSPCEKWEISIIASEVSTKGGKAPHEVSAFPSSAREVSIEEGEAPHEASVLPGATSKVSMEGEAIPSLGGGATSDRKGMQKMRQSTEPTKDLQHELALL